MVKWKIKFFFLNSKKFVSCIKCLMLNIYLYPLSEFNSSSLKQGPLWLWSYGSWICNYLCNQYLSPLTLWVRILFRRGVLSKTLCDKVCQWLVTGQWFSPSTLGSSTNKTDRHDITEILLKVVLNTITLTLFPEG